MFFFFNDTATTEIYTLSLHDALPIYHRRKTRDGAGAQIIAVGKSAGQDDGVAIRQIFRLVPDKFDRFRSEEHTSELQSPCNLVCRLLLEKKKPLAILVRFQSALSTLF